MNTVVEILVDYSGSMGDFKGDEDKTYLLPDQSTRMSLAKKVLTEEILPLLQTTNQVVVRKFYGTGDDGIDLAPDIPLYDGAFNQTALILVFDKLIDPVDTGGTPLTAAVLQSIASLRRFQSLERRLILITDGQESGENKNYESAALQAIRTFDNPCRIFIIGIALEPDAKNKARNLANLTNGAYADLLHRNTVKSDLALFKNKFLQQSFSSAIKEKPKISSVPPLIPQRKNPIKAPINQLSPPPKKVESKETAPSIISPPLTSKKSKPKETIHPKRGTTKLPKAPHLEIQHIKESKTELLIVPHLQNLRQELQDQIINSRQVLDYYIELSEKLRITSLLESGFPATTMTVDDDYVAVGRKTEQFVYDRLCKEHGESRVNWLNKKGESLSLHDIELMNEQGKINHIIECKGTRQNKLTFYLTANEWSHFLQHKENYQVYRVFNADGEMHVKCIENLFLALLKEEVVPYLLEPEILKEGRIFLTMVT